MIFRWIVALVVFSAVTVNAKAPARAPLKTTSAFSHLQAGDAEALLKLPAKDLREARNEHGETLLIKAIVNESLDLATRLANKDFSDVAARDHAGNDALLYAVGAGAKALVERLIAAGAPLDRVYGEDAENVAFESARAGDVAVLEVLFKARPELARGTNRTGVGLVETAVLASQSGTALMLARRSEARTALTDKRRQALLQLLGKDRKNAHASELRALLQSR